MHGHANVAEGYLVEAIVWTDSEGEKTIVDHNGTLRVGSAVVSGFSFSSPFSADTEVVKKFIVAALKYLIRHTDCQQKM